MSLGPSLTTSVQRPIFIPSPSRLKSLGERTNFPSRRVRTPTPRPRMTQGSYTRSSTARTVLVHTKRRIASHFPAPNVKQLASLTNTPNGTVLTKGVTPSCHGKLTWSSDQSLVASPNHLLPTAPTHHPDHLHHPSPSCPPRIFFMYILGMTTRSITTPKGRTMTKSPPVTATLSGVTEMDSSAFFFQLAILFGFLCFTLSHVYHYH